jgi:hypothetical protein
VSIVFLLLRPVATQTVLPASDHSGHIENNSDWLCSVFLLPEADLFNFSPNFVTSRTSIRKVLVLDLARYTGCSDVLIWAFLSPYRQMPA